MTRTADPATVLVSVVDDDESVRESLPDLLREFGFSTQAFSSAEEFLQSGQIERTQCLILDINMPGMSGPDLKQELRRLGYRMPIIFITAHADSAGCADILEGAVTCLVKPFSDTALQEALKKAVGP
jgi:FixJ family two-component response regulator